VLRSVNGVRINVLDEGDGHPIVFLHGLGGCWRDWEPQLESLSDRFRCVVIEHRGHGRSDATAGAYSTGLFAADAAEACRQLSIDHAYVVGLSMGGMIAQALTVAEPGLVDALVLCDTSAWLPTRASEALAEMARGVRDDGFADARRGPDLERATVAWSRYTLEHQPHVARNNMREAAGTNPEAWARAAQALIEHDTRADLHRITAPTLLVWGDEDGLIPAGRRTSDPLLEGLPDARLVVIPDAGHVVNLEQPAAFDEAVLAFLDDHACPRAA
jgi:pimeloyl-ACP methyl ester carboxylesterase